jgi:hypothetical protein
MKRLMACLLVLSTTLSFASENPILLDASCKILCVIEIKEIFTSQTRADERIYENLYVDFKGISRELLDKRTTNSEAAKLCKSGFSEKAFSEGTNCLTFKH